jgi:TonB-linked SusC/RagA family outer membrane protein
VILFIQSHIKLQEVKQLKETAVCESMHGGVRGRGSNPPTYSITYKTMKKDLVVIIGEENVPMIFPVYGKVFNESGLPLLGVSIIEKGTNNGTTTTVDGSFSLNIKDENAVLVISSVGYVLLEISVKNNNYSNIVLVASDNKMEEIIVVGYGTQKRENLTGAISQIDSKFFNTRPTSNLVSSLQGLLPGLNIQSNNGNPGAVPDINIRGFNSINGGGPLILIDGIEGNIERLNPADVENVTILKDAASAAIYGARGAFGVVLITTKKGKVGSVAVNYTNNIGWTTPTTRTDFITDPYEFGRTVDAALTGYNGTTYTGYTGADWDTIQLVSQGKLDPFYTTLPNGENKFFYKTDWYNYLFRKHQPFQNHSISVSGGSEKIKAYLSGRYYKTATIQNIVDANLQKLNLKANIIFKVTDWLQLSDNIQFTANEQTEFGGYRTGFGGIWSNTTWYFLFPFHPNKINGMPYDNQGGGAHAALEEGNNWIKNYSEQLVNTFSGVITPAKGLAFNFDYSNTINHLANSTRLNKFTFLTGSKILQQTTGVNSLTENRDRNYYNVLNVYGTYIKTFANAHNFKLMMGFNKEKYTSDNVLAQQGDLLVNNLANLNLGTTLLQADGSASIWAVQGFFGRFNYDYKNKYLLEVNARRDGSSRFPTATRWGFFPSVSGGWFVSNEKFWNPLKNIINSFKLRSSYGELGNQNVGLHTFSRILPLGQTSWLVDGSKLNYVGAPSPLPSVVSWESTKTIDFGVDIGLLRNKLTASFDWYEKNTTGMYVTGSPLPGVFGAPEPKENIAGLRNRGFELTLGYNDHFIVKNSPLNVFATLNVFNFKGKITKYPNPNGLMSTYWEGQELGSIWGYHIDGQFKTDEEAATYQSSFNNPSTSLGRVYNYIFNVVTNTNWKKLRAGDIKYVDLNKDGAINNGNYTLENHGDLTQIGNAMPQFPFGFTLGADWKNFDIIVAGAGVLHQDWYPTGFIYWGTYVRPYSSFIRKDLVADAWSPENPNGYYPQIYRGYDALTANRSLYELNDYYLTNVGYLRLKNLTIGYSIPQSLLRKISVKQLRVYFSGENILTWRFGNLTKYVDPEQAGSGTNFSDPATAVNRTDLQDYPIGKTFSFGINLQF